jgi:predicted GTPase
MPYGDLAAQRVQRYATLEDLERYDTTIEEREEYEPHITTGTIIYAGVDYGDILAQAQAECDVLVWDGGNNDLPFYEPTVHIVVADPLRAGHETRYHPGEANLRMADVVVINKMDSASIEQVNALMKTIHELNPGATLVKANSRVTVDDPSAIAGKRVLVVEDGPTLTHGEMKFGAGVVALARTAPPTSSIRARGRSGRSTKRSASTTSARCSRRWGTRTASSRRWRRSSTPSRRTSWSSARRSTSAG